ncbi:MAG: DoxX family protein [Burkholderiaceae bacterium]|jgi:putative oxidoreductase
MLNNLQNPLTLVGRTLLAVLFIASGFGKLTGYSGTAAYMASHGLPMVEVLLPLTILVELGGGICIVLGLFARYVALVMFAFLIPVTLVFHTAGDAANNIQMLKNISIMGAMLLLAAFGPGRWSLDAKRAA